MVSEEKRALHRDTPIDTVDAVCQAIICQRKTADLHLSVNTKKQFSSFFSRGIYCVQGRARLASIRHAPLVSTWLHRQHTCIACVQLAFLTVRQVLDREINQQVYLLMYLFVYLFRFHQVLLILGLFPSIINFCEFFSPHFLSFN